VENREGNAAEAQKQLSHQHSLSLFISLGKMQRGGGAMHPHKRSTTKTQLNCLNERVSSSERESASGGTDPAKLKNFRCPCKNC